MTIVIAIKDNNKVYMAADSLGSNGFTGQCYKNKKIIKKDKMLLGITGSYRLQNLLEYTFVPPKMKEDQELNNFVMIDLRDSLISLFKKDEFLKKNDDQTRMGGKIIIAIKNSIFEMQGDLSILEPSLNYWAVGSGEDHAISSLFSTEGLQMTIKDRIKKSIVCASEFVLSVNSNIQIEELGDK